MTARAPTWHAGRPDAVQFLFDFRLSLGLQAFAFGTGLVAGFIDDLVSAFLRLFDDFGCLSLGFAQLLARFLMSQLQITSRAVGSVRPSAIFF